MMHVRYLFACRHRISNDQWWLKLRPLLRIMAKHDSVYQVESVFGLAEQVDVEDKMIA